MQVGDIKSENEQAIKTYLHRGAYIAALKKLVEINHPVISILFPKMPSTKAIGNTANFELNETEIEQLRQFIQGEKSRILFQASVVMVISGLGLIGIFAALYLLIMFGYRAVVIVFVPCILGIIAIPLFILSYGQIARIMRGNGYVLF